MFVTETDSLAGTTAVASRARGQRQGTQDAGQARHPGEAGQDAGWARQGKTHAGEAKRGEACKRVQRVTLCTL